MLFKTHIALGVLAGLFCFFVLDNSYISFFIAVFASILPDIDSTKSFIGNRFYFRPLQWIIKHRGIFHSITFAFFISLFIASIYPAIAFSFFIGYVSHLFLDSITVEGIVPFWPLSYKVQGTITTGSFFESVSFWIICCFSAIFTVSNVFF